MSTAKRRADQEGSNPKQRKDGRWQINIRHVDASGAGKRVSVYGSSPEEARAKAKEVLRRIQEDLPPKDRKVTLGGRTAEWCESSLAASDRKASTKTLYKTLATKHISGSNLGSMSIDKIKPSHIEKWLVELKGSGLAESTIRTTYTVLRAVFESAVLDGDLAKNPAAAVPRPKVTPKEARFLTAHEVKALLEAAQSSRYLPLFEVLVTTGLRRGEALALTWDDVDFDSALIRVRGTLNREDGDLVVTEPKSRTSKRTVAMSSSTRRVLKELRARQRREKLRAGSLWVQSGFVFTNELGAPCDPRNALRALTSAAEKAGLEDASIHTLRHTASSLMLEAGVPITTVSKTLGHHSISITGDIYGHVAPDVSARAMETLSAALDVG